MLLIPSVFLHSAHQPTNAFNKIQYNTYHTVQFMTPVAETCSSLILIMNSILLFVFYFNLSSELVGWCTENRVFLFVLDRQAPVRRCSQFLLHCDRLSVYFRSSNDKQSDTRCTVLRRHGGGWELIGQAERNIYIYIYIRTHTFEKCAVVVRFKPEITLQPLPEFCIHFHNPKTR